MGSFRATKRKSRLSLLLLAFLLLQTAVVVHLDGSAMRLFQRVLARGAWEATEVVPGLFVGAASCSKDWGSLHAHGIDAILNAAANKFPLFFPGAFDSLELSLEDTRHQDLLSSLPIATHWINTKLTAGQRILVHCEAGRSRSVSIIVAYLMAFRGMTFKQAHTYVREARPKVLINHGFRKQLKAYKKLLDASPGALDPDSIAALAVKKPLLGEGFVMTNRNPSVNVWLHGHPGAFQLEDPKHSPPWSLFSILGTALATVLVLVSRGVSRAGGSPMLVNR